jgi:hypothetical protein
MNDRDREREVEAERVLGDNQPYMASDHRTDAVRPGLFGLLAAAIATVGALTTSRRRQPDWARQREIRLRRRPPRPRRK